MADYFPDRRTIIVVQAQHQATANQLAQDVTRDADGNATTDLNTFTDPLQAAGQAPASGPITHYWTNWAMTQAHRDAVIAELGKRFARNVTPIPLGTKPRRGEPFYVFDAEPGQWTDVTALPALSLERHPVPE